MGVFIINNLSCLLAICWGIFPLLYFKMDPRWPFKETTFLWPQTIQTSLLIDIKCPDGIMVQFELHNDVRSIFIHALEIETLSFYFKNSRMSNTPRMPDFKTASPNDSVYSPFIHQKLFKEKNAKNLILLPNIIFQNLNFERLEIRKWKLNHQQKEKSLASYTCLVRSVYINRVIQYTWLILGNIFSQSSSVFFQFNHFQFFIIKINIKTFVW